MYNNSTLVEGARDVQKMDDTGISLKAIEEPGQQFSGTIEPTEVSTGYRLGLVVVAVAMVLLLAVYLGMIILAGCGVYYHLVQDSAIVTQTRGSTGVFVYLWPALAGAVLVFFMIKPILAGTPEQPPKYSLTPESDPELFTFIRRICELVRAPFPSRVDVDCQINASASFRQGLRSLPGNDVVLTIGLPLVAGLSMQEIAGVLAHEFGHFAQGAGMRLTYLIRAINSWFARVVYERDEWDVRLVRAAHSVDLRLGMWLHLIRFTVWLSRRVLWVLMHLGHSISCFMLRQMEYDADSYEAKLAGSEAFARTSVKIRKLSAAGAFASQKIAESWKGRRLPQNLPSFIRVCVNNTPGELQEKLEKASHKTQLFDTHPCEADRVKAAMAMQEAGVFQSSKPASELFKDFEGLCQAATRFHYEHHLQLLITEHNLVPHEVAERDSQSRAEGEQALKDFFLGLKLKFRALHLSESSGTGRSTSDLIARVKEAKQAMKESQAAVQRALGEYEQAETLYQRGLDAIRQDSQQATTLASETMQKLGPTLERFEQHTQNRLGGALQLLDEPEVALKIQDAAALKTEAAQLEVVFARLGEAFGSLQELRRKFSAFTAALSACALEQRRNPRLEQAEARVNELAPQLKELIQQIRQPLREVPYPFHHARKDLTLDEFARNDIPATHKMEALCNDCTCHLDRLLGLYQRVLSRLAYIALTVEQNI